VVCRVLQNFIRAVSGGAARPRGWQEMCHDLLRLKDEASVLKLATAIFARYQQFEAAERLAFFQFLLDEFGADPKVLGAAIAAYQQDPSPLNVQRVNRASLPARRQLFEVLNMATHGTMHLISMRSHLLELLPQREALQAVDDDFVALFNAWFNRGFLTLEQITWETPASVLEKLIAYEAVHEINGWDDLHHRVSSARRCYAFFHPAMPGEPVIFVQVALTNGLVGNIVQLIEVDDKTPTGGMEGHADTAVFYSISNCQAGLRGIAFGDLLIKQVVDVLTDELPQIRSFATLSPVPGFCRWLADELKAGRLSSMQQAAAEKALNAPESFPWKTADTSGKAVLTRLCAHYLSHEKRNGLPLDPVARFHLKNGARLERINWAGDTSAKGIAQSAGILVNYVYDPKAVTRNHEAYVYGQTVVSSNRVAKLAAAVTKSRERRTGLTNRVQVPG